MNKENDDANVEDESPCRKRVRVQKRGKKMLVKVLSIAVKDLNPKQRETRKELYVHAQVLLMLHPL